MPAATMIVFPLALAVIAWLPGDFAFLLAATIALGAAGGAMTILKAIAIPEFLTRRNYGAIKGVLNMPITLLKACAPGLAALAWQATGDYQLLLHLLTGAGIAMTASYLGAVVLRRAALPERGLKPRPKPNGAA